MFLSVVRTIFLVDVPGAGGGGGARKSDRDAHRFALGCKLHILVSLRLFGMESHYTVTPDNSNLQGKSKQVRVIGSLKKIAGGEKKEQFLLHSEHFNHIYIIVGMSSEN